MSFIGLCYDSVFLEKKGSTIKFSPNFICPKCKKYINGKITEDSPRHQIIQTSPISPSKDLNINRQIAFIMPCCETQIQLYVAVHKTAKQDDLTYCISVASIPDNWWMSET